MKPEVVALAILALIIVSFAGSYIIGSAKSGVKESFDSASRAAALECEKKYQTCLREGKSNADCTKESNTCISAIVNPSVSTATPAPSTGAASSSSAAAASTYSASVNPEMARRATGTYDASGNPTGSTLTNYNELYKLVKATAADRGQTGDESEYAQAVGTLSPEFKKFLKEVQANVATKVEDPTDDQLALAQGAGLTPTPSASTYTPSATFIKPHEKPPMTLPTMTANAPTDKGTKANKILIDSIYTPSIRQMIRDDVAQTVREEVEANQINNPYSIDYESY
jgi:hypothetical protein